MNVIKYLLLSCLISCNVTFEDSLTEITLINEMQGCEELNMHYKIISSNYKGQIVLPIFDKKIDTENNNTIFFKTYDSIRKEFKVKGYFSKNKHNEIDLGCAGAHYFKIDTIVNVKKSNLRFKTDNK